MGCVPARAPRSVHVCLIVIDETDSLPYDAYPLFDSPIELGIRLPATKIGGVVHAVEMILQAEFLP
ncbi:hypothetical protein GCM10027403_34280 [Arthrobacter tecti]